MSSSQRIFAISRARYEEQVGSLQDGFQDDPFFFSKTLEVFLRYGDFFPRNEIEEDETYLQVIVYGVLERDGRLLALWRKRREQKGEAYKETRHNEKIGLACGGHVEEHDAKTNEHFFVRAMLRELSEELVCTPPRTAMHVHPYGILWRNTTLFDRVHLGLLYCIDAPAHVSLASTDEYDRIAWCSPEDIAPSFSSLEEWGKVLLALRLPKEQITVLLISSSNPL